MSLAQPEHGPLARFFRRVLLPGKIAERLRGAGAMDLGQRENRLLEQLLVLRMRDDRVEGGDRLLAAHLTEPEHGLLADLSVGIVARHREHDVLGLLGPFLRQYEHRLFSQACRAGIALGEHVLDDRHGVGGIHLQQGVHRGDARIVVIVGARRRRPRRVARDLVHSTGGVLVSLPCQLAQHARQECVTVAPCGRAGVLRLLFVE